jgi:hypothetical protein
MLFLGIFSSQTLIVAQDFEILGELEYTQYVYQRPSEVFEQATFSFVVVKAGSTWSIRTIPSNPIPIQESFAAWDGKRLYCYASLEAWTRRQAQAGEGISPNVAEGTVFASEIPNVLSSHALGPVWLMYCSSTYLEQRADSGLIEPAASRGTLSGGNLPIGVSFTQKAFWNLNSSGGLPNYVAYCDSGMQRDRSGEVNHPWPSPFDKGFTNAVFSVSEHFGSAAEGLPKSATLSIYVPNQHRHSLDLMHRYHMKATNVVLTPRTVLNFPPTLPGPTIIADHRFARDDSRRVVAFEYFTTNRFLSDAAVKVTAVYSNAIAKTRRDAAITPSTTPSTAGRKQWIILIFIMVSTTLMLVFWKQTSRASQR